MAIDDDGTIWVWGKGSDGQLGIGTDDNANTPQRVPVVDNTTQDTSYFRIQAAIDDASDNDVIVAEEGTYSEYIDFSGKAIVVESTNPYNWEAVTNSIIDASNHDNPSVKDENVVEFDNSEGTGSVLRGFTITGRDTGIYCYDTSPTISNCLITENSSPDSYAGGMYCLSYASPSVKNCVFSDNSAFRAGGMYNRFHSPTIVTNCTFTGNSSPAMLNNYSDPTVTNSIFWGNGTGDQISNVSSANPTVSYCCIQNGYTGGSEIITDDPLLTDYHLSSESPCIDEGTDTPTGGLPETDIDGEPRILGSYVDIGADEYGCYPIAEPNHYQWVLVGVPDCWCDLRQCNGDADDRYQGKQKYWVSTYDLDVLVAAWNEPFEEIEGETITVGGKEVELICADFDHLPQGKNDYRVSNNDLDILIYNWMQADKPEPDCFDDYLEGRQAGSPVKHHTLEEIVIWLEEVWLSDKELRKAIGNRRWKEFLESLIEEWLSE